MNFQESQIGWLAAQNAYVTKKDQGDKVIIFDRANAIFGEYQESTDYRLTARPTDVLKK